MGDTFNTVQYKLIFINTDKNASASINSVSCGGYMGPAPAQWSSARCSQCSGHQWDQCCCIPVDLDCFDTVGQGRIDPKIVNRPPAQPQQLEETCLFGYKTCCYAPDLDISVFWCSKNFYNFYY